MSIDLSHPYEVAIAGGGLAGASLAIRLARAGSRVILIDGATFPREKLCGEFLSPECWDVIDRLGLVTAIEQLGYHPIRRVRITTPRGRVIDAEFAPEGRPPGIGISRSALDNLLIETARDAGVTVIEGTRIVAPIVEENRVVGLVGRHPRDGQIEPRARVIVAADGRYSSLVRQTGRVRGRSWFRPRLFGLKRHFDVDPATAEPDGTVGLHLVAGGYAGTCLVEGGLTNLCALLPDAMARSTRGNLDRIATDHLARNPTLARLWESSRPRGAWKTVANVRVESADPHLPGILYAGDCRGTVDPLGGQGMTMAFLGAEVLAPFVQSAIRTGTADAAIQRAYRAAWDSRFLRRINLCRLFHHILIHPAGLDLASHLPKQAERILASCFDRTRDRQ
jgi:flavin-dependent dehydrogenase